MKKIFSAIMSVILMGKNLRGRNSTENQEVEVKQSYEEMLFFSSLPHAEKKDYTRIVEDGDEDEEEEYIDIIDEENKEYLACLIAGTRYEATCKDSTAYWAHYKMFEDGRDGSVPITLKTFDESTVEMLAYKINSHELDILKKVAERGIEEQAREGEPFPLYEFETFSDASEFELPVCFHPHISSYTSVSGNMYDDNIDTYGVQLGVKAVRVYAFYNTDTNEFVFANSSYYVL